jgi:lactate permease
MIGGKVAILHAAAGTLIPLFVVGLMTRFFGENRSFLEGVRIWKFALFAAFAMTVPYVAMAHLLGPEFPSIFGVAHRAPIVVPAAQRRFLMPRGERPWDFGPKSGWEAEWTGTLECVT